MDKKYQLLVSDTIRVNDQTLYRIQALRDIPGVVKKGDLGGYIASESNLSHNGKCWVWDNAKVFDNAQVRDNALVSDNAQVSGNARIYGYAWIGDNAQGSGNAKVYGYAQVFDCAQIGGDMKVGGKIQLGGNIILIGQLKLCPKEVQKIEVKSPVYIGGIEL